MTNPKYYGPGCDIENRNQTGGGWPLATLWLAGHEKYPDLIAHGLPRRVKPWLIDVEIMLTTMTKCETK